MSFELDEIAMLFGDDFVLNEKITLRQPTIGDVISIGEDRYFSALQLITAIPSDMKAPLWDSGVDWTQMSDLEMFAIMVPQLRPEESAMFFYGLDFSAFQLYKTEDGDILFRDDKNDITIDSYLHQKILRFFCKLHGIKKKPEKAGNKYTKMILIDEDRNRIERSKTQKRESQLVPIISTLVNTPGFKHSLDTVRTMKYYAFIDSVLRLQTMSHVQYLSNAYYSGNIDTKKFDVKKLDMFCNIHKE